MEMWFVLVPEKRVNLWYNRAIKRMRSSLARKNYQSTGRFLLCRA